MFRILSTVLVLALIGCGEKKVDTDPTAGANSVNASAEFSAGVVAMKGGQFQKALNAFERAVGEGVEPLVITKPDGTTEMRAPTGIKPDYAKAWFNAGVAAEKLGQADKAVAHYEKALSLDAGMEGATLNLGSAYIAAGNAPKAVEVYRAFVTTSPANLEARNNLTDALTAAKLFPDAIKEAQEVLARDPKNVGAYRNLSRAYYAQGNYEMSLLCAEKAATSFVQ